MKLKGYECDFVYAIDDLDVVTAVVGFFEGGYGRKYIYRLSKSSNSLTRIYGVKKATLIRGLYDGRYVLK